MGAAQSGEPLTTWNAVARTRRRTHRLVDYLSRSFAYQGAGPYRLHSALQPPRAPATNLFLRHRALPAPRRRGALSHGILSKARGLSERWRPVSRFPFVLSGARGRDDRNFLNPPRSDERGPALRSTATRFRTRRGASARAFRRHSRRTRTVYSTKRTFLKPRESTNARMLSSALFPA